MGRWGETSISQINISDPKTSTVRQCSLLKAKKHPSQSSTGSQQITDLSIPLKIVRKILKVSIWTQQNWPNVSICSLSYKQYVCCQYWTSSRAGPWDLNYICHFPDLQQPHQQSMNFFFLKPQNSILRKHIRKLLFLHFLPFLPDDFASVPNINIKCDVLSWETWKHFKKAF